MSPAAQAQLTRLQDAARIVELEKRLEKVEEVCQEVILCVGHFDRGWQQDYQRQFNKARGRQPR